MEGATRTTCPYCGVGCGVLARALPDGSAEINGDPDHPANYGRLCSKGSALGETLSLENRLLYPMAYGKRVSWGDALDLIANRFKATISEYGPDSVAFYVSGQLLTEDYYVANKLMKGFIGSGNIDTNSRLCMASSVAGHKRAFGSDTVPGLYEDLELADLIVLTGSNLAWCHPVLFQRIVAAREERGIKIIIIDPRETPSCEIADLHLALAPGSDVALFNGLLAYLAENDALNNDYIERYTDGFTSALQTVQSTTLETVADITGLVPDAIREFYSLFAKTEKAVTIYSQGVNQSSTGTDKVNAIINCHLATGRIGRPGMGPFSVTGQPNAMGGREVGGLANQLACHMAIEEPTHRDIVQRFWDAPRITTTAGTKAVDMFEAVADGRIKAIWIMATNPVDSLPNANRVRAALENCPFVIVSDIAENTDTVSIADVLLPATAWGEKSGTVTNSERCISRQRAFLVAPGEAKADWWAITQVARRMGFTQQFAYETPTDIFTEYAQLSAFENDGSRDFDIGACTEFGRAEYDDIAPFYWPTPKFISRGEPRRFFANGGFFTKNKRAQLIPTPFRLPASKTSDEFPLILNTGRIRDQWHTMTRTSKTPRLMAHIGEPFAEIHPADAEMLGIKDAELVLIESANGSVVLRALITDHQLRGSVFVPMHWTDQLASTARIGTLIAPNIDNVSGQPELKFTPIRLKAYTPQLYGFAATMHSPIREALDYWALARSKTGFRLEFALLGERETGSALASRLLRGPDEAEPQLLAYHDVRTGQYRFAAFSDNHLIGAVYLDRRPVAASRNWIASQIGTRIDNPRDQLRILAGRSPGQDADHGATICSCMDVGVNQIIQAITAGGCTTVQAIGTACGAGTNCGSCRAEIRKILDETRMPAAAE